jgi:hypothetical protein
LGPLEAVAFDQAQKEFAAVVQVVERSRKFCVIKNIPLRVVKEAAIDQPPRVG